MNGVRRIGLFGVGSICGLTAASAAIPAYEPPLLQCRANFSGAFNLPSAAFFSNATPDVNNDGAVAVRLDIVPGGDSDGLWYADGSGAPGSGTIVFTSQDGAILSDVSLNDGGRMVAPQGFSSQDGIYFYDVGAMNGGLLSVQPFGASGWSATTLNNAGQIGYRAIFSGRNTWAVLTGPTGVVRAAEVTLDQLSPFSFLFTPAFNDVGDVAGKARYGGAGQVGEAQPDRIIRVDPDGEVHIIAEDRDANPASIFARFDNSVDINALGQVVFNATLVAGGRGVFVSNGVITTPIATTAGPNPGGVSVTDLEFFRPRINDAGLCVFRAFGAGGRAIFVGDGAELIELVREHDLVATDLGDARIDQHDGSPVFGGGPSINDHGDVAFQCGLTPPGDDQIEWGSGIFVARAGLSGLIGDLNCDGVVTVADIGPFVLALTDPAGYAGQFPNCDPLHGDTNTDGAVTVGDIGGFVSLLTGP